MLHVIGIGAALAITSRLLTREVRIPEHARVHIEDLRESLEELSDMTSGFSPTNPGSWFGMGARLLDRTLENRTWETEFQWCLDHGFEVSESRQFRLWNELIWNLPRELAYKFQKSQLVRTVLPNGASFVCSGDRQPLEDTSFGTVYLPADSVALKRVFEGVRAYFWGKETALLLDVVDNRESISPVDLSDSPYLGNSSLIEELGHFRAQGLRRNILFQGKPGTGKSTLCREAARRLSCRTLILTSEYLSNVAASEWKMLLQMLDPEMVIVDDIDRISYNLESKLSLFEEGHCEVQYILMTSNDHETLPQALRRPGRIDMIFKLDDPEPWVLDEVIRGLADREGVEIPTEQLEHLRRIAQETSTAHVVEVFRRAKVQGWGYELNGDITYTDGFRPQKPKDHGKPYVGMPVPDWFTSGKPLAVFKEYFSEIPEEIVTEITMDWVDQLTR